MDSIFLPTVRKFEPRMARWEARMLPLCYAITPAIKLYIWTQIILVLDLYSLPIGDCRVWRLAAAKNKLVRFRVLRQNYVKLFIIYFLLGIFDSAKCSSLAVPPNQKVTQVVRTLKLFGSLIALQA